jgi:uncharacterized membrane protein
MSVQTTGGQTTNPKTWAIVVWVLYLSGLVIGITALVGVILAYVKRGELAGTPFESHMTYAIRTFWISLLGALVGVVLSLVLVGFLILLAVGIWCLYRMIRGLVLALDGRPIPDPTSWL